MEFSLPKLSKKAIPLEHFPTKHQAFIFRAIEYVSAERIAKILGTTKENVIKAAADMGLDDCKNENIWLTKGYITIIKRLWHILPYDQLIDLLGTDKDSLAVIMREEDFLDVKLKEKPICEPVKWRSLTEEEIKKTAEIKKIIIELKDSGKEPFDFDYDIGDIKFSGKEKFKTRMIYAFSGLYQNAFEVDSEVYCPDELLSAYAKLGVNAVWTQAVLSQLTEFPFAPEISKGYEKRLERMRKFTERLDKFGLKLMLYINEPRAMPKEFFDKYPHLKGHIFSENASICTSTPEVQEYLTNGIESLCRAVPKLAGFFTITRSENQTNCYSHANSPEECTCERCKKRSVAAVIGEVVSCIEHGAHKVNPDIKVMAWSWAWNSNNLDIIKALPKNVILLSQSELAMPFNIGGVKGEVKDYSMSIVGPGERAKSEWKLARKLGLECGAKVQINTTWECSTVPAIPVYDSIEKHMQGLIKEDVEHILLGWTLGGYPSKNIIHAAKYFFEYCKCTEENENIKKAVKIFADAFTEFPFHISTLYKGPQNAGPSNLLFDKPTGYNATMTCFSYDDVEKWRSIYPRDVFEDQFKKLCSKWKEGLKELKNEPENETVIMAKATYLTFRSCYDQICFYRERASGNKKEMVEIAKREKQTALEMLSLMNKNSAIGFEAANHYYYSKGQLKEKIINCEYIIKGYA